MNASPVSTVHMFLEKSAQLLPDKMAFIQDGERVTYGQINSRANRLSLWLLEQGVISGDRIVMLLENSIEYVVSYYGVLKAGAVAVPLNCDLKADSLSVVLSELQPKAVIACCKAEQNLRDVDLDSLNIA